MKKLKHNNIVRKNGGKKKKNHIEEIKDFLDLHYEFRKNTLTLEIEYRELPSTTFYNLDDTILNTIWIDLQMQGYKCTDKLLSKMLNSKLVPAYNPIKAYFETLPDYDGEDYITKLANTITIQDISIDGISLRELWIPYLKKWLTACAASCVGTATNHTCLILVGGQGVGKTTWLNRLCPKSMKEYLVCSHINPSLTDKITANFLAEKWLVNIDDQLETIFGKDFNSMKAIITAPFVTNRKTWHRFSKTRKRVCSFMGSVNEPKFLTDVENRRYLVFSAAEINLDHTINMDMVWAQALHYAKDGYSYWFSQEEMIQLNKVNEIYRQASTEEEWLSKLYKPTTPNDVNAEFLMPSEILTTLNLHSNMRLSKKKLSTAMKKLGFGQAISKRLKGFSSPRNVYPVVRISEKEDNQIQSDIRNSFTDNT